MMLSNKSRAVPVVGMVVNASYRHSVSVQSQLPRQRKIFSRTDIILEASLDATVKCLFMNSVDPFHR